MIYLEVLSVMNKLCCSFLERPTTKIYKILYSTYQFPTIGFDATGGCCKKILLPNEEKSGSIMRLK